MADHAGDLGVDQLLRHGGADLGIGLVVFGHQRELDVLAADLDAGGIGFLDREARAVLVVLAEMRDTAGKRADVADLDFTGAGGCAAGRLFGLWGLLAAARERERNGQQ